MATVRSLSAFFMFAAAVVAQTSTSTINGTVTDASGAVIPGAAVSALNEGTGIVYRQQTTAAGVYSFAALPLGPYTIGVEMRGFKTAKSTGHLLQVGSPIAVNVALEVGETAETVSVTSSAEQLQTTNAALGNVIERKAIVDLPLNGRNPLNLLVLEPGVVQRTQGSAGTGVHVNGSRDHAFNTTIDGIEANESSVPNPLNNVHRLNPDNVQEYKVTTSNATPEEGRNSGASISIATRSGTNQFHGTAYDFFRNTKLNANQFFSNALGTPKPDMKLNQYGFEMAGPIQRNKTFFFGSWQGQALNTAQPIGQLAGGVPIVYTPEALAGKYRYFRPNPNAPFVLDGTTITANSTQLVNPATGALRPGVRECGSTTDLGCIATFDMFANDPRRIGVDPTILKLLNTFPKPNAFTSGDGLNTAAYIWNSNYRVRGPHVMARIDHAIDDNNTIFGRYLFSDQNTLDGDPNNSRPRIFPGFAPLGEVYRRSHNLALSYRRVISPRIVNELTIGVSRFLFLFTQGEANPSFPAIPPFDFANITEPYTNRPRTARAVTTPQILDNLSIVTGSHSVKMGFNFRFYQHNDQRGQPGGVNVTPVLSFSRTLRPPSGFNTPTSGIAAADSNRLLSAINELMGIPAQLQQIFLADLRRDQFLPFKAGNTVTLWSQGQRMKQYNFYLQDEWKLQRNVTVNYGARWEINMAPSEAGGRAYAPNGPLTTNSNLVSFVNSDRWYSNNNFGAIAPRIGLTWSPGRDNRTVIRTGYGIAFDPISSFQVTAVAGRVPGLTTSCQSLPAGSTTPGCIAAPDRRVGEGFPLELTPPTVKPSSFLAPQRQLLGSAPNIAVFDQNLQLPTVHQWNLNVQRELPIGVVAQVAYVGRRGTRLYRAYDVNQINADPILSSFRIMQSNIRVAGCRPDGTLSSGAVCGQPVPLVTSGVVNSAFVNSAVSITNLQQNAAGEMAGRIEQTTLAANLRPNQQFGIITYIDSGGDSYYHSFQSTLRKRFSEELQLGLSYALGKSIDNQSVDPVASSSGGGLSTTNSRTPADIRNWRNERARSDFDRTHVLNAIWLYELPFGRGANPLQKHVLGGWSLNGIYSFNTGEPFTVLSGVRTSNFSHVSRAALKGAKPEAELREIANVTGPVLFRDALAFEIPAPGDNGIGRNLFQSPNFWNLDLGIQKMFPLTERFRLQFRAEFFNALNHANFDNPGAATDGSNQITNATFGRTCCEAVAPSSTQNIIQTGESARVIQFALKLTF